MTFRGTYGPGGSGSVEPVIPDPPTVSPVPTVLAGPAAAVVQFAPVEAAQVEYDLHVVLPNSSGSPSFEPDPTTLFAAGVTSPVWVRQDATGTPLPFDDDAYFALVARNLGGEAPPSTWVPGRPGVVPPEFVELAVDTLLANNVLAEAIDAEDLSGKRITGALIRTAAQGARWELQGALPGNPAQARYLTGFADNITHPDLHPGHLSTAEQEVPGDTGGARFAEMLIQSPAWENPDTGTSAPAIIALTSTHAYGDGEPDALTTDIALNADRIWLQGKLSIPPAIEAGFQSTGSHQSIPNNAVTSLLLGYQDWLHDITVQQNTVANGGTILTLPESGLYEISAYCQWNSGSATGRRNLRIERDSGLGTFASLLEDDRTTIAAMAPTNAVHVFEPLQAGDRIRLTAFQNSGGALAFNFTQRRLVIRRLRRMA